MGVRTSIALAMMTTLLVATPLMAQPNPADRALATELFQKARELMAQKNYAEACPRFEESQRLDPGGGTLLNLALCNEAFGKTATAWSQFNQAIAIAQRDRRRDREDLAQEHATALEPRLSRMVIEVSAETDLPDLVVKRDGSAVARLAWGTAMPVDPGEHLIEASAPGRISWSHTINVGKDGGPERVAIPVLELVPAPPAPEPPAPDPPAPQPPAPVVVVPRQDRVEAPRGLSAQALAGITTMGVGGASLTVGAVLGFVTLGRYGALDCPDDQCPADKADEAEAVNDLRWPSTAMLIVGAVGVSTGLVVLLTAPKQSARATVALAPAGLVVRAQF